MPSQYDPAVIRQLVSSGQLDPQTAAMLMPSEELAPAPPPQAPAAPPSAGAPALAGGWGPYTPDRMGPDAVGPNLPGTSAAVPDALRRPVSETAVGSAMATPDVLARAGQIPAGALGGVPPPPAPGYGGAPDLAGQMYGVLGQYQRESRSNMADLRRAGEDARRAAADSEAVGEQKAAETAGFQRRYAAEQQASMAQDAVEQQKYQGMMDDRQSELRGLINEVRTAPPAHDSRSVMQRIGGAIAIGLGSWAQSINGGENMAAKLVSQQIENDLQSQRDALTNKRGLVGEKLNELGMLRNRLGDMRQAQDVFRARRFEQAKTQLESLNSEYAPAEMKAKLAQTMAGLDEAQAGHVQSAIGAYSQTVMHGLSSIASLERGAGKPDAKAAAAAQTASQANKLIDSLESTALGGGAGIGTGVTSMLPAAMAPKSNEMNVKNSEYATQLARLLVPGGRASPEMIKLWEKRLPAAGDSQTLVKQKIKALRTMVQGGGASINDEAAAAGGQEIEE